MFYTIYKTTNQINGKIYIGSHITDDLNDGYIGSGYSLGQEIKEFGKENFECELLFVFDNFHEMNEKEKELVNREFLLLENTLNRQEGGRGKWITNRSVIIWDSLEHRWCRIPIEKYDKEIHITPTTGSLRVIDTLLDNQVRRIPIEEYKSNKNRYKTATSGFVSVRFLDTGKTKSIPITSFDKTKHRKVIGGIVVVDSSGKKQRVDRSKFDSENLTSNTKNKVTVFDKTDGIRKHVSKEEFKLNREKYKSNTEDMLTALNKNTGEFEYISCEYFNEHKDLYGGTTTGQWTVWDIATSKFKNIKTSEFNREYHRLFQDKKILCTDKDGNILIDFWGSKQDFCKIYGGKIYEAARNETQNFQSKQIKKFARFLGSNFKLINWRE